MNNDNTKTHMFHFFLRTMPNTHKSKVLHPTLMRRLEMRMAVEVELAEKNIDLSKPITIPGTNLRVLLGTCPENPLAYREMMCLVLLATGKTPEQCADILTVSVQTVATYEKRIREKLGTRNRINSLYFAIRKGYLSILK